MPKYLFLFLAMTTIAAKAAPNIPYHLDPEMSGAEYRALFDKLEKQERFVSKLRAEDPLKIILEQGKRNLDWIQAINAKRDPQHKLELTTPETTRAYPIESPGYSNRKIILEKLATVKNQMPKEMSKVIFGTGPIPHNNPLDDKTFLEHAREMNRVYENASRWLLQEPYLMYYRMYAKNDIRGYYFLSKEDQLEKKLNKWDDLDEQTQKKYSEWLVGECFNTHDLDDCQSELKRHISSRRVLKFHTKYVEKSKQTYNEYFDLQNPRREIVWNYKDPNNMYIPFIKPNRRDVEDWFKSNVQDEWRIEQWALKIDYKDHGKYAKIVFEANATPHVNGIGGDTITMDANRPLNEYIITWAIRHEFGHVLGFPDCYAEFYDDDAEVMINYQLDITNLMCSRRGHLQKLHYTALKDAYYKDQKS